MEKENAFNKVEYEMRRDKVREKMENEQLDLLLIFDPANQFYLSGYQTVNQDDYRVLCLPLVGEPLLLVWHLEEESVKVTAHIDYETYRTGEDPIGATVCLIQNFFRQSHFRRDKGTIGLDGGEFLNIDNYIFLLQKFRRKKFVMCNGLVEDVRMVKSQAEIEQLQKAAKISEAGMRAAVEACEVGNSENEVVARSLASLYGAGSELIAFGPVVSAGARSGIPHISNRRRRIGEDETVLIELGGCYNRYTAPLMRTVYLGQKAPTKVRKIEEAAEDALKGIIRALRPGVCAEDIAKIGSKHLPPEGLETIFHYVFGYSVGVSFPPTWADRYGVKLRQGNREVLKPGMVLHLPMSVRIPAEYAVGISETVLITKEGCKKLTDFEGGLITRGV